MYCKINLWVSDVRGIMIHWPMEYFEERQNYCQIKRQTNNLVGYIVEVFAPGHLIAEWLTNMIKDGRIEIFEVLPTMEKITFISAQAKPGNAGEQPGEE